MQTFYLLTLLSVCAAQPAANSTSNSTKTLLSGSAETKGSTLLAFYVVPSDYAQFKKVDPTWGGPHITISGFEKYPDHHISTVIAKVKKAYNPTGSMWHIGNTNNRWVGGAKGHDKYLALTGTKPHGGKYDPSKTLEHLGNILELAGVKGVWSTAKKMAGTCQAKGNCPHVTFDHHSCDGSCPHQVKNIWSSKTHPVHWYLIAVTRPDHPGKTHNVNWHQHPSDPYYMKIHVRS